MASAAGKGEGAKIEVSNCTADKETLELYFENKKRSGGGDVAEIIRKGTRYLITFEDPKVAERVVRRSHSLLGDELKVNLYIEESTDSRKLLIKNVSAKTTSDCLGFFVKDLAGSDVIQVDKDGDRKQAVVTFEDDIDVKRVIDKFDRRPEKKKFLDRSRLQLFPVNETNTIVIRDLPDDVTEDWLELYFENKKRSGGGDVDKVIVNADNCSAKVIFSDSSCVTSVLTRSHTFKGEDLSVAALYGHMEVDSDEDCGDPEEEDDESDEEEEEEYSPPVKKAPHKKKTEVSKQVKTTQYQKEKVYTKPFQKEQEYSPPTKKTQSGSNTSEYSLPVNRDVFQFIESNPEHGDEFRRVMDAADANVFRGFGGDTIRVSSSKTINGKKKKQEWEEKSQAALAEFFGLYSQKNVTVNPKLLQSVLSDLEETPSSMLRVRKDEQKHEIHLTGKTSDVDKAIEKIRQSGNAYLEKLERESRRKTSKISNQSTGRLYLLQNSKQLDAIRDRHAVDIAIDLKSNCVIFTGCQDDLSPAMCEVYEAFNSFHEKYHNAPKRQLIAFLQRKPGKRYLLQQIKSQNLEAGIEVRESDVVITSTSEDTIKAVIGIIDRCFKVDEIRIKDDTSGVFEKDEFKSLVHNLQKSDLVHITVKRDALDVVGVRQNVEPAVKNLHEFIQANLKTSTFLDVDENIMRFIKSHKSEGDIDEIRQQLYQTKGKLTLKPTGIYLEGNPEATGEAKRRLQGMVQNIERKKKHIRITDTGHCKLFIEGKGEHLAKSVEQRVSCAIHVNKKGQFAERKDVPGLSSAKGIRSLSSPGDTTLHQSGAKLVVKQGDISVEKVDAIVNSIGSDIESPFRGGISKAILAKAGNSLLQETQALGSLNVGEVKSTGSGNLKCKRVYHCVMDRWDGGKGEKVLRGVVKESLQKASRANFSSIAFPSLGTGFLRFPHDRVAEIMIQEALSFARKSQQSSVKDIRFIVFDADSVDAFKSQLGSHKDSGAGGPRHSVQAASGREEKYAKFGSLALHIKGGDLTKENVDAIVNPVAPNLEQGQVGRAIINSGGNSIDGEYSREKHNLNNGPIITGAGSLQNTRGIIHVICPNAANLANVVKDTLELADSNNMNSVALPAIGTGYFGLSSEESARGIIEGVKRFSRSNPQSLTSVKVVIFQRNMVSDFARKLGEVLQGSRQPHATSIGHRSTSHAKHAPAHQVHGPPEVTITIFADNAGDIDRAEREVQKIINEEFIEDKIENECIPQLDDADVRRVKAIGAHNNVDVKTDSDNQKWYSVSKFLPGTKTTKALHLRGLKHDVEKYKSQINIWLEKYSAAAGLKKTVKWSYDDGSQKRPFDTMWNFDLETAKMSGQSGVYLMAEDGSLAYEVDFKTMKETDLRRNKTFKLERKGPEGAGVKVPDNWTPFPHKHKPAEPFLVSLNKGSDEYKLVENGFVAKSDGNNPTVMKIERIQHKLQYQIYTLRKRALEMKYPKNRNQRRLYHGTKPESVGFITKSGFNRSYAGTAVGTREGKGVYFAVRSGYSMKPYYSPADNNGNRFMFQVKVLVGKTCRGRADMIEPDLIQGSNGDRYDTSTDNEQNPNMYVTFHDEQAYPEYLITFR